ncbi:MAG: dTDP-4-dehydrorhamnose 3,5-epimerase [Bacteroidales bacterium]|jgi:dTDP-4-dehydrorhamnose 3,5-epimerase|nr:dTDP-4-dehydrorhamnose 3,5-epimerase [Bacteroidales bacterium]
MKVKKTAIDDLLIIENQIFTDERGGFSETYNRQQFSQMGIVTEFVQDNQSVSHKGVIRGLHLQSPPYGQGKLVRVVNGSAWDVAVDVRKKSPTYGKYVSVLLSAEYGNMFWIPEGFAHGFAALEDNTIFAYKVTNYYHKESEMAILWNDKTLNINWNIPNPILSQKDLQNPEFQDFISPY